MYDRKIIVGAFFVLALCLFFYQKFSPDALPVPAKRTSLSPTSLERRIKISGGTVPLTPFVLPSGFVIHTFADNLGDARDLEYSPGGTLLVSSPGRGEVYALPDENQDGIADTKKTVITGENNPHGLAFYDGKLYVADVDKVVRFDWDEGQLTASREKVLFSLPSNNNHNKRTLVFDSAGNLYVSVGSTCNVCNEKSQLSGTVLVADKDGDNLRIFATGLRNAPFIQFNPDTGDLWGTEMGRDYLGDILPPDELNIIKNGNNYGWPNCYGDKVPDTTFNPEAVCDNTQSPLYEIPAHSAPLGFVFINSSQFSSEWHGDILVSYHGSWNRTTPVGYKVVHLKLNGNKIENSDDFLTGFISSSARKGADAIGRPVDLIFDSLGNLYISDDKAGAIYIIQKE